MNSYWQEQYGYINKFEQYVKEWIETIDTTDIEPKRMALVESTDYFLNFNYNSSRQNPLIIVGFCTQICSEKLLDGGV